VFDALASHRSWRPAGTVALAGAIVLFSNLVGAPASAGTLAESNETAVTTQVVEQRERIPYTTASRVGGSLREGTSMTIRRGKDGERLVRFRVTMQGSREVSRQLLSSKVVRKPVPEVVCVGRRSRLASRGYFSGRKVITMVATGYDPSPASNGGNRSGRGATGLKVGHGVVAVDPKFIPLGTRLYIEGYGYAVAGDTGSAIKGNRIDLGHDTRQGANRFGRKAVQVHVLD